MVYCRPALLPQTVQATAILFFTVMQTTLVQSFILSTPAPGFNPVIRTEHIRVPSHQDYRPCRTKTRALFGLDMSDTGKLAATAFLISNVAYVGQLAFNKPRNKADSEPYELLKGVEVRWNVQNIFLLYHMAFRGIEF